MQFCVSTFHLRTKLGICWNEYMRKCGKNITTNFFGYYYDHVIPFYPYLRVVFGSTNIRLSAIKIFVPSIVHNTRESKHVMRSEFKSRFSNIFCFSVWNIFKVFVTVKWFCFSSQIFLCTQPTVYFKFVLELNSEKLSIFHDSIMNIVKNIIAVC